MWNHTYRTTVVVTMLCLCEAVCAVCWFCFNPNFYQQPSTKFREHVRIKKLTILICLTILSEIVFVAIFLTGSLLVDSNHPCSQCFATAKTATKALGTSLDRTIETEEVQKDLQIDLIVSWIISLGVGSISTILFDVYISDPSILLFLIISFQPLLLLIVLLVSRRRERKTLFKDQSNIRFNIEEKSLAISSLV